jgi:hypothetical protein
VTEQKGINLCDRLTSHSKSQAVLGKGDWRRSARAKHCLA